MNFREKQKQPKLQATPDATAQTTAALPEFSLGDRYQVLSVIHDGKTAVVYKVMDTTIEKILAIKVFRAQFFKHPFDSQQAERQIRRITELTHPHLVNLYGCGQTQEGAPYLVMDYVDGVSLAHLIAQRDSSLDEQTALDIFIQVCEALQCAHAKGLVHGHLKPSNVVLKQTANQAYLAKVVDLGTAKILPESTDKTGQSDHHTLYTSPEQREDGWDDCRADIYSLGCVMYETISGKRPFAADLTKKPIPLPKTRVDPGGELERVILRCLEQSPAQRFQTIDDVIAALQDIRAGAASTAHTRKVEQEQRRLPLVAICILGLIVISGLGWMSWSSLHRPASVPGAQAVSIRFDKAHYRRHELGKIILKCDHDCLISLFHLGKATPGRAKESEMFHVVDEVKLHADQPVTLDSDKFGRQMMVDVNSGTKLVAVAVKPGPDAGAITAELDQLRPMHLPDLVHLLDVMKKQYPDAVDYSVVDEPVSEN